MNGKSIEQNRLNDPNDPNLVHRSQANDTTAYEELIRRYYGKIYGLAYHMTGNRENAEAVVQEVFVKAWRAIGRFRKPSGFSIWIHQIAFNCTLTFCKRRNRRQTVTFDEFDPEIKASESYREFSTKGSVLRKMSLGEFQQKMNAALLKLSKKNRAAIILCDVQEMPCADMAKVMNCSEGTVRSRLFSAHQQVQAELGEFLKSDNVKIEISDQNLSRLLALKQYERPDQARVEKTIQNIIRAVGTTSNMPSLLLFPDKSFGWMLAQPRYGVAALFMLFLGLHLLERPMPASVGFVAAIPSPVPDMAVSVDTNQLKAAPIPGIEPPFSITDEPEAFSSRPKE